MDREHLIQAFVRMGEGGAAPLDDWTEIQNTVSSMSPQDALNLMTEIDRRCERKVEAPGLSRLSFVFQSVDSDAVMSLAARLFLRASAIERESAQGRRWLDYVHHWLQHLSHKIIEDPDGLALVLGDQCLADEALRARLPIGKMVKLAVARTRYAGRHPALVEALGQLAAVLRGEANGEAATPPDKEARAILKDIDFVLDSSPLGRLPASPFKETLETQIAEAGAAAEDWREVIDLTYRAYRAMQTRDDGLSVTTPISERVEAGWRPPFREVVQAASGALEKARFEKVFSAALRNYTPRRAGADRNVAAIVGLIALCPALNTPALAQLLGFHTPRCFQGAKALEAQTAHAALYALELMGQPGLEQLALLNGRLKHDYAAGLASGLLRAAASRSAESQEDASHRLAMFEESNLPDFGLDANGQKRVAFAGGSALIETEGRDVRLSWFGPDGKPRKSTPATVKRDEASALKELKAEVKALQSALTSAAGKIERLYLSGARARPFSHWQAHFAWRPLMRGPAGALVWTVRTASEATPALWRNGFEDVQGRSLPAPAPGAGIELWHPLDSPEAEVIAWRRRVEALGLRQPFKQAHREVYPLTDAERRTASYSNRFAAHILRQHQFNRIAGAREWEYRLQGGWSSDSGVARRALASLGLFAEYLVAPVWPETPPARGGALETLATDQVRFVRDATGEPVPLADLPPLVFSEIMRDVDLFVSAASIGADPAWLDGGHRPAQQARYWNSFSFGDISANIPALARKEFIETLLPQLAIGAVCTVSGRYLEVQGKLSRYQIHLGSGASRIAENNRYLCIVAARETGDDIALPFEGDSVLGVILGKAFLLANDDAIADPAILSQLRA